MKTTIDPKIKKGEIHYCDFILKLDNQSKKLYQGPFTLNDFSVERFLKMMKLHKKDKPISLDIKSKNQIGYTVEAQKKTA